MSITPEQEAALRANTTTGDPFDVHSASVAAWRNVWALVDQVRASNKSLRDALDETHLALFQRCGGVPPATMAERRLLDRSAAVLNATAPKAAPAKRADAGPFGKWEIEPALSSEFDLQYTNDDNEAFDIATRVLERLWDDMEPGDTRTVRITLNAEVPR